MSQMSFWDEPHKPNAKLQTAKLNRNDEFYTTYEDVAKELSLYKRQLINKTIYLNCDAETSNFVKFFKDNIKKLQIKKVIATHYQKWNNYYIEITQKRYQKKKWGGDGDFRQPNLYPFLEEADIVITNPPFSKINDYIGLMMRKQKKFLIVGPLSAIGNKRITDYILKRKIHSGYNRLKEFIQPDGSTKRMGNTIWFTNLEMEHWKRRPPRTLGGNIKYKYYDNLPQTIEVDKMKNLPANHSGLMGVPITFFEYDTREFIYVGMRHDLAINNKIIFARFIVRWNKMPATSKIKFLTLGGAALNQEKPNMKGKHENKNNYLSD